MVFPLIAAACCWPRRPRLSERAGQRRTIRKTRHGFACRAVPTPARAPLPTTKLGPNGYGAATDSAPAKDPPLDCFYVYPTVSSDNGMNSDMTAGPRGEARGGGAIRALRLGLPSLRTPLPANDASPRSQPIRRGPTSATRLTLHMATSSPPGATTSAPATAGGRSCLSATARAA